MSAPGAPVDPAGGDPAVAAVAQARRLIHCGQFAQGIAALDNAAALHREAGRANDEAACLHLAATAARLLGDLAGAAERADRAAALAVAGTREAIATTAERAAIAAAQGEHDRAATQFGAAAVAAEDAGWRGQPLATLVRQHARSLALGGDAQSALGELARVADLVADGGPRAVLAAQLEEATALLAAGRADDAAVIADRARLAATQANDQVGLAHLALLRVSAALLDGSATVALGAAEEAQGHALRGVAPLAYLAASVAIAELSDRLGDRTRAYATMATAQVTLADLLGPDGGRSMTEPELLELHARWGAVEFDRVRYGYEEQRRRRLGLPPRWP